MYVLIFVENYEVSTIDRTSLVGGDNISRPTSICLFALLASYTLPTRWRAPIMTRVWCGMRATGEEASNRVSHARFTCHLGGELLSSYTSVDRFLLRQRQISIAL